MKCRYCENEVEPDSRLSHLGACASCADQDAVGNLLQVLLIKKEV